MRALVTGAAGFVGSHLCAHLLSEGDEVLGVDSFTGFYPRVLKERNLAAIGGGSSFRFAEADLGAAPLGPLLDGVEVAYHLAAQPGVTSSWGAAFPSYVRENILVTHALLEACIGRGLRKVVFASSSSIYGNASSRPTREDARPEPISPYGVTKLAAEHLCEMYRSSFGVPTASLRLFTVYGPRQRPDMALAKLVSAAVRGGTFELWGDGEQTRDFTYVSDVARAFRDAALSDWLGVANIGGGASVSMNEAIALLQSIHGPVTVVRGDPGRGDVRATSADVSVAQRAFAYEPKVRFAEGLGEMISAAAGADAPEDGGGR